MDAKELARAATRYKALSAGRQSIHGDSGTWEPGEWRAVDLPLVAGGDGLHVCTLAHLLAWLGPTIWEVEVAGERIEHADKIVVERARITRPVETWNARTARLFAADCAEHVLPLFEHDYPTDDRPRRAIAVARASAGGTATAAELAAAWAAARSAVEVAAGTAARSAARSAADAAAGDVAWATAWSAAGDVAWAAAWMAAWSAAWSAIGDVVGDTERWWQVGRLGQYLHGEVA